MSHVPKSVFPFLLLPLLAGCLEPKEKKPEPETHLKKMSREILDLSVVKNDHPDWVEIDPEVEGSDPLSVVASGANAATADIGKLGFKHWMEQQKALNIERDGPPPFSEAEEFVKQRGLPGRRVYEHWVYDAEEGRLLLMLDKEARNEEFKRRGIPIPKDE